MSKATIDERMRAFDDIDADLRLVNWSKNKFGALVATINRVPVRAHRIVAERMGITGEVDHANRNPSDNRRTNIRPCTRSENNTNRGKFRRGSAPTPYKGVYLAKSKGMWGAAISKNKKRTFLGYFRDDASAARAYDAAAREHHGAFAVTNFGGL